MNTNKKQNRWRRLIRKAANLLRRSEWCQTRLFRDSKGHELNNYTEEEPAQFCMVGAMLKAGNIHMPDHPASHNKREYYDGTFGEGVFDTAIKEINKFHGVDRAYKVNDNKCYNKEQVIEAMLKVANRD